MNLRYVNEAAAAFYAERLVRTPAALDYLRAHGLSNASPQWRIGYAPAGWTVLNAHLVAEGFSATDLLDAGLAFRHRETGNLLDRFRGRLVFPITDLDNRTIGFIARDLTGRSSSKWINTHDNTVYRKSTVLYGLGQQLAHPPAVTGDPMVFVVEGATDVVAVHLMAQARRITRPTYAVAPCGTALTEQHLDALWQGLPDAHIVLAFDGDPAGRRAASRTYGLAKTWGGQVSGTILPAGRDPADLLAAGGPDRAAAVLLDSVQPLARVELFNRIDALQRDKRITDPAAYPADRDRVYRTIASLFVDDPGDVDHLSRAAADRLGVDPTTVVRGVVEVLETRSGSPPASEPDPAPDTAAAPPPSSPDPATPSGPSRRRNERATVSGVAHNHGGATPGDITIVTRHDPATGRTAWAIADGIGTHPEAATASVLAAEIAATVALRTAPPAGLHAARHALNGHYAGTHPSHAGDASLLVVTAYPEPDVRHGVRFELAWAGNCRAYTIHNGQLAELTNEPVPRSGLAEPLLTSSVRAGDISVCPLKAGPFLLCTDALPRQVPDSVLAFELAGTSEARRTARRLATAVTGTEVGVVLIHPTTAPPHRVTSTAGPTRQIPAATGPAPTLARTSFAPMTGRPLSTTTPAVHNPEGASLPRAPKRR